MASGAAGVALEATVPPRVKSPAKVRAGMRGMAVVLAKYAQESPEWAKERSSKGGTATRSRYGRDYYKFLANRRWSQWREDRKRAEQLETTVRAMGGRV